MIKFYRPATTSDFELAKKELEYLPLEARQLIDAEDTINNAVNLLFDKYDFTKQQARRWCNAYLSYLMAKYDYHRKPSEVYVEY